MVVEQLLVPISIRERRAAQFTDPRSLERLLNLRIGPERPRPIPNHKAKIRTAVGAGQAPTLIFGWGGGILKSYADAGQVEDLTSWLGENADLVQLHVGQAGLPHPVDWRTRRSSISS